MSLLLPGRGFFHSKPGTAIGGGGDPGDPGAGDLPGWDLIFNENFLTPAAEGQFITNNNSGLYDSKFYQYANGAGDTYAKNNPNGLQSQYHKDTLSVGPSLDTAVGNVMKMRMRFGQTSKNLTVASQYILDGGVKKVPWVSGPFPKLQNSWPFSSLLYGRIETYAMAPLRPARYKTAWLWWPDSDVWPRDGELDGPEGNLNGNVGAFHHNMNGTSGGDQVEVSTPHNYASWHRFIQCWGPGFWHFHVDDTRYGNVTSRVPSVPMHHLLQSETALSGTRPALADVALIEVRYVRIWSRNAATANSDTLNVY